MIQQALVDAPRTRTATRKAPDAATQAIIEARAIVADLFEHKAWIYWTDMLVTIAIGYTAAAVYLRSTNFSAQQMIALVVSGFALFRLGSYVHEITHMRNGQMLGFRIGWNLLCGIPMVMPSHFYENHLDHHNSHDYGTARDGEYLPLGAGPHAGILSYFLQIPFMPAFIGLRLLLAPLTFLHPRLRTWALEYASSYVFNIRHRLKIPVTAPRRVWAALEIACSLRLAGMFGVVVFGTFPWTRLVQLYVLAMLAMGLNYIRNLVAHRYRSTGSRMSYPDQLADSINITGGWLTELFFPLNLRYHALHHLFPALPYHNLGIAHRRLMEKLPSDSPYRQTVFPTYFAAVRALWSSQKEATSRAA